MSETTKPVYDETNEQYLKNGQWFGGFGDGLYDELVKNLKSGKDTFQLKAPSKYSGPKVDYVLDYKFSVSRKRYDWIGFRATLKDNPEQTLYFPIVKNEGFKAAEAAGLIQGLPVCKKDRRGKAVISKTWHQVDFSKKDANGNFVENKYYESYGFDTRTAAAALPIIADDKQKFLESYVDGLEKGKVVSSKMTHEGKALDTFSTVNLAEKSIDVYDDKSNLIIRQPGIKEAIQKRMDERTEKRAKQEKVIDTITQRIIPRPIIAAKGAKEGKTNRIK